MIDFPKRHLKFFPPHPLRETICVTTRTRIKVTSPARASARAPSPARSIVAIIIVKPDYKLNPGDPCNHSRLRRPRLHTYCSTLCVYAYRVCREDVYPLATYAVMIKAYTESNYIFFYIAHEVMEWNSKLIHHTYDFRYTILDTVFK